MQKFLKDEILIIRVFFVLIVTWFGYQIGASRDQIMPYTFFSLAAALFVVIFEYSTEIVSSKKILFASIGLLIGLSVATLLYAAIPKDAVLRQENQRMIFYLFFAYIGIVLAVRNADRFDTSKLKFIVSNPQSETKILDTSVIIDGRIRDLFEQNFIAGAVMVPEFVIEEMQRLADSNDPTKRARGRRGLEILDAFYELPINFSIYQKDVPQHDNVDQKLIQLAMDFGGKLITNDYNLQRVAHVHNVDVLNINELAGALKPPTFIGEMISIKLTKDGREPGQGVGYLEDGTMVVVEDGADSVGKKVNVDVTSILHTSAGRMIFAKPHEDLTKTVQVTRNDPKDESA